MYSVLFDPPIYLMLFQLKPGPKEKTVTAIYFAGQLPFL